MFCFRIWTQFLRKISTDQSSGVGTKPAKLVPRQTLVTEENPTLRRLILMSSYNAGDRTEFQRGGSNCIVRENQSV